MEATLRQSESITTKRRLQNTGYSPQQAGTTIAVALLALLTGCGGGSHGNSSPPPPNPVIAPTVVSISPRSGSVAGGTPVTITGSGFVSGATASIGGAACTASNGVSGTQISCTTGVRSAGPADVVVVNPGGSRGTLTSGFTYATVLFVDGDGPNGLNKDVSQDAVTPAVASLGERLYVMWTETSAVTGVSQVRAAVYKSDDAVPAWAFVDGSGAFGINRDAGQSATEPRLVVFNAKLYAIWTERSAATSAYQVRVAVYSGNDGTPFWTLLDGNGANGINKNAAQNAGQPQLTVFNAKLYATWAETDSPAAGEIRAAVYNGNDSAPAWTFVDGNSPTIGLNKNPARDAAGPALLAFNSKLYAAWEEVGAANEYQIRVAVYNGSDTTPVWNFVDGDGASGLSKDPSASSNTVRLIVHNSKLYAAWLESGISQVPQLRVVVYNGSDTSPVWTFVDGNGANGINRQPLLFADSPALVVVGDSLYCAWQEGFPVIFPDFPDNIRLAKYNGNDSSAAWRFADGNDSTIGLNKDPSKNARAVQLAAFNSRLYLAWQEQNAGSKFQIRVAVLE